MTGTLYLVSTPIGNLKDMTYRAVETLQMVDVIACEDTRHSMILLNAYDIHGKKLISYNKNNERNSAQGIINLLRTGKNVALISDAGMPVISDPGNILVQTLLQENLPYTIIPGANAGLSALILSGYDASEFLFVGFLSDKNKVKRTQLNTLKNATQTAILYSSCHNINDDLNSLHDTLGERSVCVVKDITKLFENVEHFVLGSYKLNDPKGEYVIVVDKPTNITPCENLEDMYDRLINEGIDKKDAMKQVASAFKISKSEVYKQLLNK
ncbi:MAG: 16S rRNA (cytidine(1402)-2'-O)-methyltransferase [Clostridia bacterium]